VSGCVSEFPAVLGVLAAWACGIGDVFIDVIGLRLGGSWLWRRGLFAVSDGCNVGHGRGTMGVDLVDASRDVGLDYTSCRELAVLASESSQDEMMARYGNPKWCGDKPSILLCKMLKIQMIS